MKSETTAKNLDASKTAELPCDSCDTNCCKEYAIFVNAHDIYRLSTKLDMAPENFLQVYGAKDFDLGIDVDEGLLDLALRQKDDQCIFLEESRDVFRCTVHDIKPSVCKSYPFQLKNGRLIQMDSKMCPVDWNTDEFETMMTTHLKKDADEWKFYDNLVLQWNSKRLKKRPLSDFLEFLMDGVALEFGKS